MFHDVYSEKRYMYFDTYLDEHNDGFGYGSLYQRFHEMYIETLLESFYFLISGCTFENYGLLNKDGCPLTENSNIFEVFRVLVDDYYNKKENLDINFFEYMYKREQIGNNKNDIYKQIIDKLKNIYSYISPDILSNNKYKMRDTGSERTYLRPIIKVIIRDLWIDDKTMHKEDKWKETKRKAKTFLIKYIDIDIKDKKIIANVERYIHDVYCDIEKQKSDKIG